jgi:hypothetical protein
MQHSAQNDRKAFLFLALRGESAYSPPVTLEGFQMQQFEYKVIAAPRRGEKAPGAKSTPDRFAVALSHLMNDLGAQGWDYLRADTLPVDERVGLTGTKTTFQTMLVFRRVVAAAATAAEAPVLTVSAPPAVAPRLGTAEAPMGAAPALGPALAAE